ncbi:organic cation/carnitine transporter 7-like isoform X2 [Quercus robur]|uniref:organic cation/carnitine transporter 7-like isoform X2 n=1 Tax=Quercus robur TaxID=38942 RepID=UPI00216247FA|nr:organic cation/carnitine transporter 7-like isoform X2 [Quercus robur]
MSLALCSSLFLFKRGFLGTAMLTSGAGFLSTFSPNYILFLIFRFLVGIGLGSGSVFACWFLEFVPADNRGKWMVVFSSFWTFGTIFEAALAWIVMSRLSWRWLLAFSSLPSFVLLLFYSLAPESPRYLCVKGNTTDAHCIMEKIAQLNKKKLPSGLLVSTITDRQDEEFAPKEDVPLLSSTRKNTEENKNCLSPVFMLFSSNLTRATLLLWTFYFGNVFSYYGIILLTSELSSSESKCGSTMWHPENLQDASLYIDVFITSLADILNFCEDNWDRSCRCCGKNWWNDMPLSSSWIGD